VPDNTEPTRSENAELLARGFQGSVWLTGQQPSRDLRKGRYSPESITHPGKMLPTIARYAIRTYTEPGDIVADPMAGIGTTVVEAMHLNRHGIGVEYEQRWAALAATNVRLAASHGAPGTGDIYTGDSRRLPALLPAAVHGRVALVITSPPYGPSTHGHVRTPGPRRGKVRKINHLYGGGDNLAYRDPGELAAGFTEILTGCAAILRPGGHVVITARPYRRHGELVDIPGMAVAAGTHAGLELVEECIALIAGIRGGVLVPRASFFQQKNVRDAIATGDPQWLLQHEDVLILRAKRGLAESARNSALTWSDVVAAHADRGLDGFTASRVDRRPPPGQAVTPRCGNGSEPASDPGQQAEGTPDPCPPYPRPVLGSDPSNHQPLSGRPNPRPQAGSSSDTAGWQ
jgi:hypothetical protein